MLHKFKDTVRQEHGSKVVLPTIQKIGLKGKVKIVAMLHKFKDTVRQEHGSKVVPPTIQKIGLKRKVKL